MHLHSVRVGGGGGRGGGMGDMGEVRPAQRGVRCYWLACGREGARTRCYCDTGRVERGTRRAEPRSVAVAGWAGGTCSGSWRGRERAVRAVAGAAAPSAAACAASLLLLRVCSRRRRYL